MKIKNKKYFWLSLSGLLLNIVVIISIVFSVVASMQQATEGSYNLNIENIRTLTNASADKVRISLDNITQIVSITANYVNTYNEVGMTNEELLPYFINHYNESEFNWALVNDNLTGNIDDSYSLSYSGIVLNAETHTVLKYSIVEYPMLANIFKDANINNLNKLVFSSEFTSLYLSAKVFSVGTYIRVYDNLTNSYSYKTLMLLLDSGKMNTNISNNNNIDNMDFYGYSNIIIDIDGNYVISNKYFQSTSLTNYLKLFNPDFTQQNKEDLLLKLQDGTISNKSFTYLNNKEEECLFTFSKVSDKNWYVLSMVPKTSFHNMFSIFDQISFFALFFGILLIVDVTVFFLIARIIKRKTIETENANIAKSNFLSSMSHDIRTPLNAIIGMTIVLDRYLNEKKIDIKTIRNYTKTIEVSGNHLLSLVNDILDISKIESGVFVLQSNEFSIANLLNNIISTQQAQIKSKNLQLESHVMNIKHEYVLADELRISQIFINILNNAIKYTEENGKITVTLSEQPTPNKANYSRFVYKVSDTGIGMEESFIDKIFQRFTRATDSRINKNQGSGIGLTIVKQIVDAMHGSINIDSKLNVGSTFTITIDLRISKKQLPDVKFDELSALIIDDDKVVLHNTKRDLIELGVKTDCAKNYTEALNLIELKQAEKNNYKVLLIDWYMPDMLGGDLIRKIRKKYDKQFFIIVITAYDVNEIEKQAKKCGANLVISKPLFKSKLIDSIKQTISSNVKTKTKTSNTNNNFSSLKVLVAEDNDINWLTLSKILSFSKIKAKRAENGKVALDLLSGKKQYDLILMDIQMPIMDGFDATKNIRALPDKRKASIPIYAMSADTFTSDIKSCMDIGMNGHLAKPIELNKLMDVLNTIYNNKK